MIMNIGQSQDMNSEQKENVTFIQAYVLRPNVTKHIKTTNVGPGYFITKNITRLIMTSQCSDKCGF